MKYKLGDKITVTSKLKRVTEYRTISEFGHKKRWKLWKSVPLKHPIEAIVVGIRTVSNGITDYDMDVGYSYDPKEHFQALLVVSRLSEKPFLTIVNQK